MMGSKSIVVLSLILLLHVSVANGSDHGVKGEQLRRKRGIQKSSPAHTGVYRDHVAHSSSRWEVTRRFLQTSAEGGSYEYVISTSDLTSSPTFYVDSNIASSPISGQARASLGGFPTLYPANLPSASPSETPTQLPTKAPILTASEKADVAANNVVAGVEGNLAQGTGNSNKLTPSSKSSTGTSATLSSGIKGSKKSTVISAEGANKATRKKKSESSKKSAAKLSAAAEGIIATGKSVGGKGGKGGQGGSNSVTGNESGGSVVSSGFEAPSGPSVSNLGPGTPPMSSVVSAPSPAVVNCSAISEGTAPTNAPHKKSYRVDSTWILREGAGFDQVATNMQNYLQTNVATAIAGCNGRRLQFLPTQSLLSNIRFGKPSVDTSSSCSTDQAGSTCVPTDTNVDMYFYGAGVGIGERLLTFLQAAGPFYPVNGLLGTANLGVFDSDGNRISNSENGGGQGANGGGTGGNSTGNNSGNTNSSSPSQSGNMGSPGGVGTNAGDGGNGGTGAGNGPDKHGTSVAGAQGQARQDASNNSGLSRWSKILIGVGVATAVLGIIICLVLSPYCFGRNGDDKGDFESMPPEQPIPRTVKSPVMAAPMFFDEKSAVSSTWPFERDDLSSNSEVSGQGTEVKMNLRGDTHVCNSATCEVCARNHQINFLAATESFDEEPEQLPSDATRSYYVNDTVAL